MPTKDRQAFQFGEVVAERFGCLSAHGFAPVRSETTLVRFESKCVYMNIYHGRQSFELGLEVGPLQTEGARNASYSMSELVRLVEPEKASGYRSYAAHDASGVESGIKQLASMICRYVNAGVFDNADLFARLEQQRKTWSHDFAREVNLTQARRKLDVAWSARDFAKVVELLGPLRSELSSTELKKLEYAEKELKG